MVPSPPWASVFCTVTAGRKRWGRRGQRLVLMFLISHLLSGSTIWSRMEHIEERGMDGIFPLSFLSEDMESEFSAGSLSRARKVAFMIANGAEDSFFDQMCGLLDFFFVVVRNRMSGIDLCHSNIFIMSVHYFLTAFRSMLGTCHNQILFIWRLSRMPRHLNASKRNTAALTDCAMALLLPAASHNLWLPADLWWAETLSSARLLLLWHLFLPQVASPFFQWLLKGESFALAQKPRVLKPGGGREKSLPKKWYPWGGSYVLTSAKSVLESSWELWAPL